MIPCKRAQTTILCALFTFSQILPVTAFAQQAQPAFKDLPATHQAYAAVEYLRSKGVISGFPDGTFRPNDPVNRAQAAKIIIIPLTTAQQLAALTTTPFSDVPKGDWSIPYIEAMRLTGIIDGPPTTPKFNGTRGVSKVEFLKMMLLANKMDVQGTNADLTLPLSTDVTNKNDWFYPYVRASLSTSMDLVTKDGLMEPNKPLTRAEVCVLMYRYLMYESGRRTQALLSEAEIEIANVLQFLMEKNDISQAEFASARALLAARGASAKRGDDPLVQAALKMTQSFRSLVRGYRAGIEKNYDETIRLAGEAWKLSDDAAKLHADLKSVAADVQKIATNMAASARAYKSGKTP